MRVEPYHSHFLIRLQDLKSPKAFSVLPQTFPIDLFLIHLVVDSEPVIPLLTPPHLRLVSFPLPYLNDLYENKFKITYLLYVLMYDSK